MYISIAFYLIYDLWAFTFGVLSFGRTLRLGKTCDTPGAGWAPSQRPRANRELLDF